MPFVMTPGMALALSFVVKDTIQTLLESLQEMSPAQREEWRNREMVKKAAHDEWLKDHLATNPPNPVDPAVGSIPEREDP
jgi:hypothetical protein